MKEWAKKMRLICFIIWSLFLAVLIFLLGFNFGYKQALDDITEELLSPPAPESSKYEVRYY